MTLSSFCGPHLNEGAERGRLLLNHLFICLLEIANSPLKSACCCTAKHQSELKFSLRTLQVHLYNQAQKGTKVHSIHLPDYCSLLTRTRAEIPFICSFPSQFDDNSFLKLLAQDKNSKVKSTSNHMFMEKKIEFMVFVSHSHLVPIAICIFFPLVRPDGL